MVPATDERTSANEPEDNTPTRGAFFERLKFWRHCKQEDEEEDEEPARLTPMPACLMHWWTPLLVAAIFFGPSLIFAIIWGGQPHWPSSKAMKLCMTIAGAGLAFSAWQQRSHDNAIREEERTKAQQQFEQELRDREQDRLDKQHQFDVEREERERNRLEQIERDEYWKRREQIYQLLGSKNPGLRLSAVALLAELADSADHSTLLNDTEKKQLQRHIIDTLCLQIRHEGLAHKTEGSLEEHASIQEDIFNQLVKRICNHESYSPQADWRTYDIDLSHTIFHFPITLTNLEAKQKIDISRSRFLKSFTLTRSRLFNLNWPRTTFEKPLQITDSELYIDQFPSEIREGKFKTTILNTHQTNPILLTLTTPKDDHNATNIISFTDECKFPKGLHIQTNGTFEHWSSERIEFTNSSFQSITISGRNFNAIILFSLCKFFGTTHIDDIDYQLGSAFCIGQKEVTAYLSKVSEDGSTVGDWEDVFPDYPYDKTAGISFHSCNFSIVNPDNTIIAHNVKAFHDSYYCFDNPLITFEDNTTDNGERVKLTYSY